MAELQVKQIEKKSISKKKSKKELSNGKSYEIEAHETHLVHAEIKTPQFDPITGEDLGVGFVQKFYPEEFKRAVKTNGFPGQKVTILHDPENDKELEDVEPDEFMDPKIVSEPGAGAPLDIDVNTASSADIDWLYEKLFEGQTAVKPTAKTKEEKIREIKARHGFLRDPRVQDEFKLRATNIIAGTKGESANMPNMPVQGSTEVKNQGGAEKGGSSTPVKP